MVGDEPFLNHFMNFVKTRHIFQMFVESIFNKDLFEGFLENLFHELVELDFKFFLEIALKKFYMEF